MDKDKTQWTLLRIWNVDGATTGIMYSRYYGVFYTLENTAKIIPPGVYKVKLTYSPRFSLKKVYREFGGVPCLQDVKGRSGIRIHIGNLPSDVSGCIAIGNGIAKNFDYILDSASAYRHFMEYLYNEGIKEFTLDIVDALCTTKTDEE
ncbi:MAG: DUF5675 family protein [Akkermansia sp.]|nr:DUF5675 family protein [Akkermansia sp.]